MSNVLSHDLIDESSKRFDSGVLLFAHSARFSRVR